MFSVFDRALQQSVISRKLTRDHLHAMFEAQGCGVQNKQKQEWRPASADDNRTGGNHRNAQNARCLAGLMSMPSTPPLTATPSPIRLTNARVAFTRSAQRAL